MQTVWTGRWIRIAKGSLRGGGSMPAFMSVKQLAEETGWDVSCIYEYARDVADPLPIYYVKQRYRGGVVIVDEIKEWMHRNSRLYSEKD